MGGWKNAAKRYFETTQSPPRKKVQALRYAFASTGNNIVSSDSEQEFSNTMPKFVKCTFSNNNITIGCSNITIEHKAKMENGKTYFLAL